ncbi:MAG TPA: hypothetical protein VFE63_12240 [Roseiarcus sp.]|nr:hypothetical protein [Roseiarcus sp.]
MSIDEAPSEMPRPHTHDFSNLQGLQLVGAHLGESEDAASESWREALKLELATRAARFHHAVDASIVLSDDGIIRWLGDPIARLAAGPDLLTPRALVLADANLPEDARETVGARLELWLSATIRRLLGPLVELRGLQDESEPVRQLAAKIADSLGVLEREPLRSQIKAFDQNSRAALRRHGVRFGAYYVYVPQSLKPAARALALQLWRLQAPGADGEEHAKTLLPLAASGRTSLPVNPLISKEGYRIAGFRPCGERAVRVDIVERLSDMIRAAFVVCSSSDDSRPAASAFLVSGQMTSLTGCSGETFASILRSLGYECFEVERSRLASPQPAVETTAPESASADTKAVAEALESGADQSIAGEGANVKADPGPDYDVGAEPPSSALAESSEEAEPAIGSRPDYDVGAEPPSSALAERSDEAEPAIGSRSDYDVGAEPPSSALAESSEEAEPAIGSLESSPEPTEPDSCAPEATDPPSNGGLPSVAIVIAWRPARRQRPERAKRRLRRGETASKGSNRRRESGGAEAHADSGEHQGKGKASPDAPNLDAREKRSWPKRKGERFDVDQKRRKASAKQNVQGVPQSEPRPTIDPTSPFAKLLELRKVLEKQGNNR